MESERAQLDGVGEGAVGLQLGDAQVRPLALQALLDGDLGPAPTIWPVRVGGLAAVSGKFVVLTTTNAPGGIRTRATALKGL